MNKLHEYFRKTSNFTILLLSISFCLNIYFILQIRTYNLKNTTKNQELLPYLDEGLLDDSQNDLIINFESLRRAINDYVHDLNGEIGVYFEYLPTGISVSANANDPVKLVSLSKVPLAMSIMKKIEKKQLQLDSKIVLTKSDLDPNFGTLWEKGEGSVFTIEQLLQYMLQESDNTAYQALFHVLTGEEINDVYDNLDIQINVKEQDIRVSAKSYTSVLKSLYFSSYLNENDSNYILDLLTNTIFTDKIPAGVSDKGIKIAHKVGVYNVDAIGGDMYSDCGIIYLPNRPYILCIFDKAEEVIATKRISYISSFIYTYISNVKGGIK